MRHNYVRVATDIHAVWDEIPPVYRLFINDELLTERTYIWRDQYLEEHIQLDIAPGKYRLRLEKVKTLPNYKATQMLKSSYKAVDQTLENFVTEEIMSAERAYLAKLGVHDDQMEFFLDSRSSRIQIEYDAKLKWYQQQELETKIWFENTRVLTGPATIKGDYLIRVHSDENT